MFVQRGLEMDDFGRNPHHHVMLRSIVRLLCECPTVTFQFTERHLREALQTARSLAQLFELDMPTAHHIKPRSALSYDSLVLPAPPTFI